MGLVVRCRTGRTNELNFRIQALNSSQLCTTIRSSPRQTLQSASVLPNGSMTVKIWDCFLHFLLQVKNHIVLRFCFVHFQTLLPNSNLRLKPFMQLETNKPELNIESRMRSEPEFRPPGLHHKSQFLNSFWVLLHKIFLRHLSPYFDILISLL